MPSTCRRDRNKSLGSTSGWSGCDEVVTIPLGRDELAAALCDVVEHLGVRHAAGRRRRVSLARLGAPGDRATGALQCTLRDELGAGLLVHEPSMGERVYACQ